MPVMEMKEFYNASLVEQDFRYYHFSNCTFYQVDLTYVDMREATFESCRIISSDMSTTHLKQARLYSTSIVNTNLHGSCISYARLERCYLHGNNLREAILTESMMKECKVLECDLTNAKLDGFLSWNTIFQKSTIPHSTGLIIGPQHSDGRPFFLVRNISGTWLVFDGSRAASVEEYKKLDSGRETLAILDYLEKMKELQDA